MPLRVIQLSDCHLQADPAAPYRGQDGDTNLEKVWRKAKAWGPDVVLMTGDLSEDGSAASYERLRDFVGSDVPVLGLPGNHDEPEVMREYFSDGPWGGPFAVEAGSWLIVCLDSKIPGRIEGGLSENTLGRLKEFLASSTQSHVMLALHHQPILVDAPWIDRYPLSNPEPFLELVESDSRIRCVVWGHIHHHFEAQRGGVTFLGSPSTAANSLTGSARFDLDPAGPACRTLELGGSGSVKFGQLFGDEI